MKYTLYAILLCFFNHAFCEDFIHKNLPIGEKVEIPHSEFYIGSIGSLANYNTKDGYEHYLLFSKKDNSFRIVINENCRTFSIYLSAINHNYFAISNNYASGESIISIYKIEDKEPYVKKVYQTPEYKNERTGWEIKEWTKEYIILTYSKNKDKISKQIKMETLK